MNLSFEQFKKLASEFNLIPLFEKKLSDLETPVSAFLKLKKNQKYSFLLESVEGGQKWGRYSFLGVNPSRIFSFQNGKMFSFDTRDKTKEELDFEVSPLEVLKKGYVDYKVYEDPNLPRFLGGLVGYVGYDCVASFEKIKITHKDFELPILTLMHTHTVVIFDRLEQSLKIVAAISLQDVADRSEKTLQKLYEDACERIQKISKILNEDLENFEKTPQKNKISFDQNMPADDYKQKVERAKEYIQAGDVMQVVLSLRFETDLQNLDPFLVYRELRHLNPSPYMYYFDFDDFQIVGASPEVLVRLEDDDVHVRPIAGTRPRGKTQDEDEKLEQSLINDPKERAEHIMLLDLGRNDIGRVAQIGTVSIDNDHFIERYSHVIHLVSHVSGKILEGKDMFDVLKATFPAGTLSGAPKVRALEIIDELETCARGIYGGGVGYMSYDGNLDFAIAIRTAWFHNNKAFVQAGAGIVADSNAQKEFEECQHKAQSMITAIESAL